MREVVVVLTDGFADWEASYVTAEINKERTGYRVKTAAIDPELKTSMGGFRVQPDYELSDRSFLAHTAMLILPGGTGWAEERHEPIRELVEEAVQRNIEVAAICDATVFLGRHGFLDHKAHTGNTLAYMRLGAPDYRGEAHYVEAQAVSAPGLITANGSAAVEFSKHILERLGVLQGRELDEWYHIFKSGYLSQ
ncbi:Putative intracellular protease/amidase [Paenibacillus sp. UNCCL117]|uniref:type 1 glutamine amidotransferase family protein n=1 Tax=unclassified Paenibacillus TaxID=185978 RepID=UPI000884E006|nr:MULTISPECIES: type 1 glutamine amidotransferase family protein [unclassified Paenibacillus]SDD18046.1 Putative intracellular protease/amidase [Paenibacillus sp. cl123]SFW35129.1 Putative intracellular protease/amidase [Paenibacillus sp. UNCCL117]